MKLLNVRMTGHRAATGRFAAVADVLEGSRRSEAKRIGSKFVSLLKDEAPVRTERLRKGLTYKTFESGKATKLVLYSAAPYTDLVLRGRGPVEAKHAKALRFEPGPPGSGFIFRKRVGPAKANDFVGRVVGRAGGEMEAAARRIAAQVASAWAG